MIRAFDTETHKLRPGQIYPRPVCLSYAYSDGTVGVVDRREGVRLFRNWLLRTDDLIVAHEARFDLGALCAEDRSLLPLVFDCLVEGRIKCTAVRQLLFDIADGATEFRRRKGQRFVKTEYGLDDLADWWLGRTIEKSGGDAIWRLRYNELDGVPITEWPEEAKRYAINDSIGALDVFEAQSADLAAHGDETVPDEDWQNAYSFAFQLLGGYGFRTDGPAVDVLDRELIGRRDAAYEALLRVGLVSRKPDGFKKNMKAITDLVVKAYEEIGQDVPRTKKNGISTEADTLLATASVDFVETVAEAVRKHDRDSLIRLAAEGNGALIVLAEAQGGEKVRTTYVPAMLQGITIPVTPYYEILKKTGRTSCRKPNAQNPPRAGGVRELVIAREGFVYGFADYHTIELCTLAQVCLNLFGRSAMADALNAGQDLHTLLAADMLGITYDACRARIKAGDREAKRARQLAKIADFGYPGGMGWEAFKDFARGYGVILDDDTAKLLRRTFMDRWIEMDLYFDYVGSLVGRGHHDAVVHLFGNGLVCGGKGFTDTCNIFFQGLAAAGAKRATLYAIREAYIGFAGQRTTREITTGLVNGKSPLHGSRPNFMLHDELGAELPYIGTRRHFNASKAADRLSILMEYAMTEFVKDVPIMAPAAMHRRWYKGGEPIRINGYLVPSRPAFRLVGGEQVSARPEEGTEYSELWVADLAPDEVAEVEALAPYEEAA